MVSVPKMVCLFKVAFDNGLRFPLHPFIQGVLQHFNVSPSQLSPNGWGVLVGLLVFFRDRGLGVPSVALLLYLFSAKETAEGFLYFSRCSGAPLVISDLPSSHRLWLVATIGNMTLLARSTPWAFRLLGPPPRIYVSVRFIFCIICMRLLDTSNSALSTCLSGARIDLNAEDNVIALVLAECPPRSYAELIKSDLPGPSSSRSARSAALRAPPPSSMKVSPLGPSAAKPTKGELLDRLGTLSRKHRSVKRKTLDSVEKDRPASVKLLKLGASSSSPSTHVRKPEQELLPPAEAPKVLSSQPCSGSAAKAKGSSGGAVEQPLAVMPITVWNLPAKSVRPPFLRAEELEREDSKTGGDGDSLLLNAELAAGAVSSILKDFNIKRSSALLVNEALALSL